MAKKPKKTESKNGYSYSPGRQTPKLPAQVVGEELERIATVNDGELRAKDVVNASRPAKAVLHPEFEWNDKLAAELHREHQARNVINVVRVIPSKVDGENVGPIRAFVNVVEGNATNPDNRSYRRIEEILDDPEKRQAYIDRALRALIRIRKEFVGLQELAVVWNSVDQAVLALTNEE